MGRTRPRARLTRNPMYAGLAVAFVGAAIAIPQFCGLAFLPLVLAYVNWSVIPVEEASLRGVPVYDEYRATVRRRIYTPPAAIASL